MRKKSIFTPVSELEWLGILWNAREFSLKIPDRRIIDLRFSIEETIKSFATVTARKLAQCVGRIISMSPVLGNITRLMTRYCYICIESRSTWDSRLAIGDKDEIFNELIFWSNNINSLNTKRLDSYSKSSVIVFSDASSVACGAYTVELDKKVVHQMWDTTEACKSSTWREMKAIEQALKAFQHCLKGKTVKWLTDNQNCISIVKSGSMKTELHSLARSIFSTCTEKGISIDIKWIPRSENVLADYISKMIDWEDWGVSDEFFTFMNDLWGPFTVDRFANKSNTKLPRYNSLFWNTNTEAIDAFTQDWAGENNWLVPPLYSVLRVMKHMLACKAEGTLIVPRWSSSPFWPMIFRQKLVYQDYITDVIEFGNPEGIFIQGSNTNSLFGSDRFMSPVLAVRIKV